MQFVSLRCYCYGKTRQMWSHEAIHLKSYDLGQMALFDDFDFLFPFQTHLLSETILLPCPLIRKSTMRFLVKTNEIVLGNDANSRTTINVRIHLNAVNPLRQRRNILRFFNVQQSIHQLWRAEAERWQDLRRSAVPKFLRPTITGSFSCGPDRLGKNRGSKASLWLFSRGN